MTSLGVEYPAAQSFVAPALQQLESESRVAYVRVQWVDLANTVRARVLPLSYFKKLLKTARPALCLPKATLGLVGLRLAKGFGAQGEMAYVFDLKTLRICPWAPGHSSVMGWFQEKAIPVGLSICPRSLLARLVHDIEKIHSTRFLAGFETEFILINPNKEQRSSVEHVWSASSALYAGSIETIVMQEIADALQASDIDLQMYHAEAAPNQYEVVTGPLPPLEAVDALIHTRETIYNIANKHGLRATLTPRLHADSVGSGTHLHISVHGSDQESEGVLIDGIRLRRGEASFLAGLLDHLSSLTFLTCPTAASYDRVRDGIWSGGTYVCWGVEHKETPLRLCNPSSPTSRNIELKVMDGTANPYLALAGVLAAGSIGLRTESPLVQRPLQTAVAAVDLSVSDREQFGISKQLPVNLQEARGLFQGDDALRRVLGEEFVDTYLGINKVLHKHLESLGSDGMATFY